MAQDNGDGTYTVTFTASVVGETRVSVRLDNVEMAPLRVMFVDDGKKGGKGKAAEAEEVEEVAAAAAKPSKPVAGRKAAAEEDTEAIE